MSWLVWLVLHGWVAEAGRLERVLDLEGALAPSDMKLPAGESADTYPIELAAGDRVVVEMSSKKLDTYLVLKSPGGNVHEMDDTDGELGFSQLDLFVEESGTWIVYATSKLAGEKGKYNLVVSVDRSGGTSSGTPSASSGAASARRLTSGESVTETLGAGDPTLNAGEWYDLYEIELEAGETLVADLRSTEFDTYVAVRTPSGGSFGNDDHEGDRNRSRVEQVVEETGVFTIFATTYAAEQGGSYQLSVSSSAQTSASADGLQRWSGTLADGDNVLSQGEYSDVVRLDGQAGERWILDLRSSEFDPFLILRGPDGEQSQNDDFEGARDRSLLDLTLTASGEQAIGVTTYTAGQTGRYDLTLRRVTSDTTGGVQEHSGTLASGDSQLDGGEWFDAYTFEGVPGQTVRVDLRGDYDTYVGLLGPTSFRVENDDGEGPGHSFVETVLSEAGTHRVVVTSYQPGQGGSYTLKLAFDQVSQQATEQRDVTLLTPGRAATGTLADGDLTLPTGEWQDVYAMDVELGQMISVSLASSEFDPYVAVVLLDGSVVQNDDWEGRSDLARVDVEAPASGRYRVLATSYRVGASGAYSLSASVSQGTGSVAAVVAPAEGGRTFGIFMGISDYPADGPTDLAYTADDARQLYDGMVSIGMAPEHGRLLVDSEATAPALFRAVADLSAQMSAEDRLMLFYSGHGGRVAHAGTQASDPDGFDETLALFDRQVTDDELAEVLQAVTRGTVLLVLDSCFSGGFSKDVISQPGRMGLFSSHEDVTSAVAAKFRAGGYLARFMVEAIGERRADDGDGVLTALELSQYLYERYRSDVKSMPQDKSGSGAYDDIVMTGQNLGYQQIIVDRGGVGPSSVLFAW